MKAEHTAASINVTSVITGNLREGLLVRQLAYSAISRGRGESVKPRGLARGEGGVLAMGVIANRRMKLKKEIQAIKELNEQEKQAQAQKAAAAAAAAAHQQQGGGGGPEGGN
ncbi:hypothetical protein HZH68_005939 [Vespula germanica]|uniref:Uncharacterized protein n=1 Tax=Vespula germanica TaxID=30212 RepID=A0A834KH61_VESGE|nr:hypothetical protein HZH68_005939 [Vespula germanica]